MNREGVDYSERTPDWTFCAGTARTSSRLRVTSPDLSADHLTGGRSLSWVVGLRAGRVRFGAEPEGTAVLPALKRARI
jgi:hypothetical protein